MQDNFFILLKNTIKNTFIFFIILHLCVPSFLQSQSFWKFKSKPIIPVYEVNTLFNDSIKSIKEAKIKTISMESNPCPPNIDFETGNFDNWKCYTGTASNDLWNYTSSPIANRHQILSKYSTSQTDIYGGFPRLCPYGGMYSIQLGNDDSGKEAEKITYTYTIPATKNDFMITYYYAVVFQDPNHSIEDQPRFKAQVYDVSNSSSLISCASCDYTASSGLPGFYNSNKGSNVLYKPWTPVTINLSGYAGHTISLEFSTQDCTQGAHFGYAYIDVSSDCSTLISGASYCSNANSITLTAPSSYQTYTWWNEDFSTELGKGQAITLTPPPSDKTVVNVDLIPYSGFGCRDTAITKISVNPCYEKTFTRIICSSDLPYNFGDTIFKIGTKSKLYTLNRKTINGCDSIVHLNLTVNSSYNISLSQIICSNELPFTFRDTIFDMGTKSKSYILKRKTITGCDSIVHLNLTVNYSYNESLSQVICSDELPFTFRDTVFKLGTTSKLYTFHRKTTNGCDSVVNLKLTVNSSYNESLTQVICSDELPFAFRDTIFKKGTTSKLYAFQRKTTNGCDSIVHLNMIINSTKTTVLSDSILQNESYTKYGYFVPLQKQYGNFTFYQYKKTISNCDSTIILNLKVSPDFLVKLNSSPRICANDQSFTLNYIIEYGDIQYNAIKFNEKALFVGFKNIEMQNVNKSYVQIPIPTTVIPDNYTANIEFENGSIIKTIPISFTINYPSSIILQKWNDVLALYNSSNNGGYEFTDYQWYKNDIAIEGATKSYLYLTNNELDKNAEYCVKVTRVIDGVSLFSCPIVPTYHPDITIYPTLLSKSDIINIQIQEEGTARLVNISGITICVQNLHNGQNKMNLPQKSGTYILSINCENSELRQQLLIVK